MKALTSVICLLCISASAQTSRYETLAITGTSTATIQIQSYESAAVVSASGNQNTVLLTVDKGAKQWGFDGDDLMGHPQTSGNGDITFIPPKSIVFRGPTTFTLFYASEAVVPAYVTLEITPQSFPADQTVIVPPGTNQVYVGLESSTNLVNWSTATNGVYGSPDAARFFRIHMQGQ